MNIDDLNALFKGCFSRNRGPGYSVEITAVAHDLSQIDISVTFHRHKSYCCAEPGCHLSLKSLRSFAIEEGMEFPDGFIVRFHGIIEPGTIFESSGENTIGYEYDAVLTDEM